MLVNTMDKFIAILEATNFHLKVIDKITLLGWAGSNPQTARFYAEYYSEHQRHLHDIKLSFGQVAFLLATLRIELTAKEDDEAIDTLFEILTRRFSFPVTPDYVNEFKGSTQSQGI